MRPFSTRLARILLLCALAAITASGCGKKQGGPGGATAAKVNGTTITEADVDREVDRLVMMASQNGTAPVPGPEERKQLRGSAIQNLIDKTLLAEAASKEGVAAPDTALDAAIQRLKSQYPDEAAFQSRLQEMKMTEADVRKEVAFGLTMQGMAEKHKNDIADATSADAAAYYGDHPEQFKAPEEVRARHILILAEEAAPDTTKARARALAEKVLAEVKGGLDFTAAAKKYSQDPGSAANGGDLGSFAKGRMVPAFENAAFALQVGEVSGVVETPYGYHIIQLTDKTPERTLPIEEVEDRLIAFLNRTKNDRVIRSIIDNARKTAKIEIKEAPPAAG